MEKSSRTFLGWARSSAVVLSLLGLSACDRPAERSGPSSSTSSTKAPSSPGINTKLSPMSFQAKHKKMGGILLDVRTPGEVARGSIRGASVVDIRDPDFKRKVNSMQKDKPIFVYCASGGRSASAADTLSELGFKEVYDLKGGISSWQRAGLPVEKSARQKSTGPAKGMSSAQFDRLIGESPLVFVDYQTQWCTPCRQMAPIVTALEKEWSGKAKVLQIDIDESEELSEREKVQGVPVFVIYKDGKEVWRYSGLATQDELESQLLKAQEG